MAIDLEKLLADTAGGGAYMSADEKQALHESAMPFVVTSADALRESQFGDQTVFTIKIKGDDEQRRLAFGHNESRARLAAAIADLLAGGEQFVGPFYLAKWSNGGRTGWEFSTTPPTADEAPELPKASDAKRAEGKAKTPAGRVDPDDGDIPW